ncbi:MAG TPA: universal stress protein, partial [Planctomycetota bacterium]|nr:universal stress protein [Planctomycetota bacterium]
MAYRILVVLDGSPASEAALPDVERIAGGGATVHLLQLVHGLPPRASATSAKLRAGHDQALSSLAGLRERFPDVRGLDFIRTGHPAEVILQTALEFDIHLITMAPHLRSTLLKASLGSAAQSVVRRARAAVLLRGLSSPPSRKVLRRILV